MIASRLLRCVTLALVVWVPTTVESQVRQPIGPAAGLIQLEIFVRPDSKISVQAERFARDLGERTPGLEVVVHDVIEDRAELSRLWQLARKSGRDKPVVPAFHCCNRLYFGFASDAKTGPLIEDLYTAHVYTRSNCSRCQAGKAFISRLSPQWPAVRFTIHEITGDVAARRRYEELCRSRGMLPALPTFYFAGEVIIGYQGDHITGAQWEDLIRRVAGQPAAPGDPAGVGRKAQPEPAGGMTLEPTAPFAQRRRGFVLLDNAVFDVAGVARLQTLHLRSPNSCESGYQKSATALPFGQGNTVRLVAAWVSTDPASPADEPSFDDVPLPDDLMPPDDVAPFDDVPLPDEASEGDLEEASPLGEQPSQSQSPSDTIQVPFLGQLRVRDLGLPLFTFLVGLVDGFNPCAMWILVFLLSVLVNIKDRRKILIIAGTFVVVSGLAYFAFMAAWLNLFLLIGIARKAQVILGLLALVIGAINVKDFFAFKQGVSLSIPESSKPGLYRRVREIVSAKYLTAALAGVIVLAVIVNMIELLCTAGLPALYTQILTMHELPLWKNYAYLALYIAAYMLDDAVLLTIVVATLSHRKLQEREGRWLKLVSGLVILVLGLVMIFRPEWLQLGH